MSNSDRSLKIKAALFAGLFALIIASAIAQDHLLPLMLIFGGLLVAIKWDQFATRDKYYYKHFPDYPKIPTCRHCGFKSTEENLFDIWTSYGDIIHMSCLPCSHKPFIGFKGFMYIGMAMAAGYAITLTGYINKLGWFLVWVGLLFCLLVPVSLLVLLVHVIVCCIVGGKVLKLELGNGEKSFGIKLFGLEIQVNRIPYGGMLYAVFDGDNMLKSRLSLLFYTGSLIQIAAIIALILYLPESIHRPYGSSGINLAGTLLAVNLIFLYSSITPRNNVITDEPVREDWSHVWPDGLSKGPGRYVELTAYFSMLGLYRILHNKN